MNRLVSTSVGLVWLLVSIGLGFGLAILVAVGIWFLGDLADNAGLWPVVMICRFLAWAIAIPACLAAICALLVAPFAAWFGSRDDD